MRLLFAFLLCPLFIACAAGKIQAQNPCTTKQVSGAYNKINDSVFVIEPKGLGRTYLNLIIDSCRRINNAEIHLTGYITFTEGMMGNERKMPDVDIIQATQTGKRMLKYMQYLGKTDQDGKFDITIQVQKKGTAILLDKLNFNYTLITIFFKIPTGL